MSKSLMPNVNVYQSEHSTSNIQNHFLTQGVSLADAKRYASSIIEQHLADNTNTDTNGYGIFWYQIELAIIQKDVDKYFIDDRSISVKY